MICYRFTFIDLYPKLERFIKSMLNQIIDFSHSPSQSAPTILVYQVGLIFFLKKRSKIWVAKQDAKNRVLLFKKKRGQTASSLFK